MQLENPEKQQSAKDINGKPRRVLIPFVRYGRPKKSNSFLESAFSSDLGLSKSKVYSNTSKRYPQRYSGFGTRYMQDIYFSKKFKIFQINM